uniref:Uncharacterized protein n=1 Tax=Pithovirus LCPAC302 TaxID=2506593 RepID=A0A481Z814_9VIRU|nr:MAG: hypothetical protein LCPAC302_01220 [Pithovirus LCPAC302]
MNWFRKKFMTVEGQNMKLNQNVCIKFYNRSSSKVTVSLYEYSPMTSDDYGKTIYQMPLKSVPNTYPIIIESGNNGEINIPEKIDWNKDYPLNDILNYRKIKVLFSSGDEKSYPCTYLNYGKVHDNILISQNEDIIPLTEVN